MSTMIKHNVNRFQNRFIALPYLFDKHVFNPSNFGGGEVYVMLVQMLMKLCKLKKKNLKNEQLLNLETSIIVQILVSYLVMD